MNPFVIASLQAIYVFASVNALVFATIAAFDQRKEKQ